MGRERTFRAAVPLKEKLRRLKPIREEPEEPLATPSKDRAGDEPVAKRLFVGGIDRSIDAAQLRRQFERYGRVTAVTLKDKSFKPTLFAYIDITCPNALSLHRCLSTLNTLQWKGRRLRVEYAAADPLDALRARWAAGADCE